MKWVIGRRLGQLILGIPVGPMSSSGEAALGPEMKQIACALFRLDPMVHLAFLWIVKEHSEKGPDIIPWVHIVRTAHVVHGVINPSRSIHT